MDATTPQEGPDPFVVARQGFWDTEEAPRTPATFGTLASFLNAEYRPWHDDHPADPLPDPGDRKTALLRRTLRLCGSVDPEELLAATLNADQRLRSTVTEAWPLSLRRHGTESVRRTLTREILDCTDPETLAHLIDLATAGRLHIMDAAGWASLARRSPLNNRPARLALWRHLALQPPCRHLLPKPDTATEAYERLLLTAATGERLVEPPALPHAAGLLVVQSMLLGEMDTPGEGSSGGLGVLLAGLGDALARTERIDAVITLVTKDARELLAEPTLLRGRGPGHWTLSLPTDPHATTTPGMGPVGDASALTWWTRMLLEGLGRRPDLVHVRYADDRSLAVAEAARELGTRLVFTATPDPHRRVSERHAGRTVTGDTPMEDLRQDLHRVFAADRLVDRADAVIGIPGRGGTAELVRYLPQLAAVRGGRGPIAPPEGITAYQPAVHEPQRCERLLERLFETALPAALEADERGQPILLTVGRLHPLKQQHVLVQAWIESGLHLRSTLVLVGGSPRADRADSGERQVRKAIADLVAATPAASARLAMVAAMPNTEVRRLERALARSGTRGRAYYVCPSAKEEFGIAVLEAMDAGLPVAATSRGGIPHYVEDMVNGLLLDTSSSKGLTEGLEALLSLKPAVLDAMARRARATVRASYSIDAAASAFASVYAELPGINTAVPKT
ncbi:glycosyltransferase [Streptomyces sp. NBC_00335]|uniref:glycosyltransferase n=1 Tax=unclassified Streptomyces TaxID=2593676 RepID=UPI002257C062|nr:MULTISPECIES: glycosyltransferase [unclassified Streptomyces]MCX5409178.1 glycosyltransferase [Streptomyces sp. NBC_00086]